MRIDIRFLQSKSMNYAVFIDELQQLCLDGKAAIITNETIAALHLENIKNKIKAKELHEVIIKDGEKYKNLQTIEYILNELFKFKLDRKSTLIAFGGGVVGDMTGFAAAIYQRGINFIQVPTTLLAQVDASVGGKTGVNNSYGKNLIGAFYQPRAVYCESEFLKTLPEREFSAGVAEIIKMAVMFDKEFFYWLLDKDLKDCVNLKEAIAKSIKIKADVVAQDERERGIRAVLNYGHTFAHVIEQKTNYCKYLHGEAVAVGMLMANELAARLGLLKQSEAADIEKTVQKFSLPTRYKIENIDDFYDSFLLDKKSSNSKITFILPNGIGNFVIRDDISEDTIKDVLKVFGR
ncbi:MAG: 3-dehydroquinate synthase [Campylobacteraceae bacterium]|jgi:3-dehydroquinate synthase|nr:3-dehydroquinate synthase [Campylobacteraceae bacterium]